MYALDKLYQLQERYGMETTEGELANYFINHLSCISRVSLQKCIDETGISKATIHRFYTKNGFNGFKDLTSTLAVEYQIMKQKMLVSQQYKNNLQLVLHEFSIDDDLMSSLVNKLMQAQTIIFYGNPDETTYLRKTIAFLRGMKKKIYILNVWDQNIIQKGIDSLSENDAFIIVETSIKLQYMFEMALTHNELFNIHILENYSFSKIYIGEESQQIHQDFLNIGLPYYQENVRDFELLLLDYMIVEKLQERTRL